MPAAQGGGGSRGRTRAKNQAMAAAFKAAGIERTTGRCAQCYRIITIESAKSRYVHLCRG